MSTKKATNATPNPNPTINPMGFDPFATFQPMMQESLERLQSLYDELAAVEREAYDRAKAASAQLGTLFTESIDYAASLAREWRQLSLDMTRRGAEAIRTQPASA
jgi:hypothetical protein